MAEHHLEHFVSSRTDARMFDTPTGRPLNMSNFQRRVAAPPEKRSSSNEGTP